MFEIFAAETSGGGTLLGVILIVWGIWFLCKKRKEAAEKTARNQASSMTHVARVRRRQG